MSIFDKIMSSFNSAATSDWSTFWSSAATTVTQFWFLRDNDYATIDLSPTEKSVHGLQLKGKLRQPRYIGKIKPQQGYRALMPFNVMSRGFEHERIR